MEELHPDTPAEILSLFDKLYDLDKDAVTVFVALAFGFAKIEQEHQSGKFRPLPDWAKCLLRISQNAIRIADQSFH